MDETIEIWVIVLGDAIKRKAGLHPWPLLPQIFRVRVCV